jgi:putative flippase GtrA
MLSNVVLRVRAMLPQVSAYIVVSALALAIDLAMFQSLVGAGLRPKLAGITGYLTGLALHYILSSRFVFDISSSTKSATQRRIEFLLSGLIGVLLTWGIIWVATEALLLHPIIAKGGAVGVSFVVVFLIRRHIVFAAAPRVIAAGRLDPA